MKPLSFSTSTRSKASRKIPFREVFCSLALCGIAAFSASGCSDDDARRRIKDDDEPPTAADPPCKGLAAGGTCVEPKKVARCLVVTGNATPQRVEELCVGIDTCQVENGSASCKPPPGLCAPESRRCNGGMLEVCNAVGSYEAAPCETSCVDSAYGAYCPPNTTTQLFSVTLHYEARGPNASLTDWETTPFESPASGLLVVSLLNDGVNDPQLVDIAMTNANGSVQLNIPLDTSKAVIGAVAARLSPDGQTLLFSVAVPDVPDGKQPVESTFGADGQPYIWTIDPALDGQVGVITENLGSGALRLFDYLRYLYDTMQAETAKAGKSLVVWLRPNTTWDCGACFAPYPKKMGNDSYASQIWIPASAQDQSFWSDAVTAHELGHWVMASYGTSPNEGGKHCLGVPVFPGMAWSEGWATYLSSSARQDPIYYDKQQGSFFWLDIEAQQYGKGDAFVQPNAGGGILQRMDENLVASILYAIQKNSSRQEFLNALQSPAMNTAPFGRGYKRQTWSVDAACQPQNVVESSDPVPMLADFLDAFACSTSSNPALIDEIVSPYPYSVSSALATCP